MPERKVEDDQTIERLLDSNDYFFSLVKPTTARKKRRCLRCAVVFLSSGHANRVCGSCAAKNNRSSLRAGQIH